MIETTALILEDSPTQATIIAKMIAAQGWSSIHCPTLREANETLTQVSVQAIFLDVFVGVYNSLVSIERFRALAPNVPIIVMTAGSNKEDIEKTLTAARQAKADYVLRKPFSETQLKAIFASAYQDIASRQRRRHVLIIDDSQTVRSLTATIVEQAGHRVSKAASMEEAFDNIDVAHVDLALCDVFMPGMGGLKGMRTIRRIWPNVKIIAMSAGLDEKVSEEDALNATRKIGADAQITKPFTSGDLVELISLLLSDTAEADAWNAVSDIKPLEI